MVNLGMIHYVYIIMTIIILVTLLKKREIVFPCIIGVLLLGFFNSGGNLLKAIQVLYNSLVASGTEFLGIVIVIALVVSMSKALSSIGADEIMVKPIKKVVKTKKVAFLVLGVVMLVVSLFVWPSPAVALVGALMLPVALEVGLPAIWAASAMNLFGHGLGLSGDFVIQGAPSITSKAAGISNSELWNSGGILLWVVMGVVTIAVSFIMLSRDLKKNPITQDITLSSEISEEKEEVKYTPFTYFIAIFTPLAFVSDVVLMLMYDIKGGDATALIGGTAVMIMCLITICNKNLTESLEQITDNIKDGFIFAMKIFAPVIVIAAFFFMGSGDFAKKLLDANAPNILNDVGIYLSSIIPMSRVPVAIIETLVGITTGLDGSGFSGLPLVGALAQTFSSSTNLSTGAIASLGQLTTVYVGGGTIIPWGVIPVAAICNVKATDLARNNLIPVGIGLAVTTVVAMFIM